MSKFKEGDYVKVMELTVDEPDEQAILARRFVGRTGLVANVVNITLGDPYDVEVIFEDDRSLWFASAELEAIA